MSPSLLRYGLYGGGLACLWNAMRHLDRLTLNCFQEGAKLRTKEFDNEAFSFLGSLLPLGMLASASRSHPDWYVACIVFTMLFNMIPASAEVFEGDEVVGGLNATMPGEGILQLGLAILWGLMANKNFIASLAALRRI